MAGSAGSTSGEGREQAAKAEEGLHLIEGEEQEATGLEER